MSYDAIIVGAGINGLVAATTLAKAGRRVVVVDKEPAPGGSMATDDIGAGARAPAAFATADRLPAMIVRDLDLERHGLRLLPSSGPTVMLVPDGDPLVIPAHAPETAFGEADAAAYRELARLLARIATALEPVLNGELPAIERRGFGDIIELLTLGLRLRRLGRRDMPEVMRLLPMPLKDLAEDRFHDPLVQAAVIFGGLRASWLGPFSPGGALSLLLHGPAWGRDLFAAPVFVAGGPGAVGAAAAAAAREAGVELRTAARVIRIRADDDSVQSIVLENGEALAARLVISALDPRTTLIELLEPGWLEPDFVRAVGNIRMRGTVSTVRYLLDALPDFGVDEASLRGRLRLGPSIEYLEKAFDPTKYGALPANPMLEITIPSLTDPSLALEGRHVMHVWTQYTPHELREGSWEDRRDEMVDNVSASIDACAPGFSDRIVLADALTPADMERRWGLTGGHLYHGEMALDQAFHMRPVPGWYDYRTPLPGLYLCGPGCHPGGGVLGISGRNAARRALRDL